MRRFLWLWGSVAGLGLVELLGKEAGVVIDAHQDGENEEEGHHHTAH